MKENDNIARFFLAVLAGGVMMWAVTIWELVYLAFFLKEPLIVMILAPLAVFETCGILLLSAWVLEEPVKTTRPEGGKA